jgi:long-chain acyl-CoA synthetase
MEHYLNHINAAIKKYWDSPALCNFGAETFTYGDIARGIEKYHILFKECGIKKDEKIAICGRNSAQWGIAFLAAATYDAVLVPLLPDFLPKSVVELTCFSDCRMLIVDNDIYRGLERDDVLKAYEQQPGFLGIYNLLDMSPIVSFSDEFTQAAANLDEKFKAKYPNGVTANDVDYSKSNDEMERLALISFTSGTSSSPKGVMLPVRSLSSNLRFGHESIPANVGAHIL